MSSNIAAKSTHDGGAPSPARGGVRRSVRRGRGHAGGRSPAPRDRAGAREARGGARDRSAAHRTAAGRRGGAIKLKRAYDPRARGDGRRVLVERLWPRGLKKESLAADAWVKEVAPSPDLRKWFDHRVERWQEFRRRYRAELDAHPAAWEPLLEASRRGTITLLYSAHDTLHNSALVLRDYLVERQAEQRAERRAARRTGRRLARRTGRRLAQRARRPDRGHRPAAAAARRSRTSA